MRHQCSEFLWKAQWQTDRPQQHLTQQYQLTSTVSLCWLPCGSPAPGKVFRDTFRTLSTQSLASTEPFHWLLQPLTGSATLLWHSLLISRRRGLVFFRKGNKGSLRTREERALTSEQECSAGRSGARIPSGAGCAGPGGSRRTCSAPPAFPQTCSQRRARSPGSWCWRSSGAWRCLREQRVRHRPWERHWEAKQTQGEALQMLPGSHCLSRLLLAGGLSSAGGRQVSQGNMVPAMENNKTLTEPQNKDHATSVKIQFFGKELHNLKIIPQNWNFYGLVGFWFLFFFFLAAVLSLKKLQEFQLGKAEAKP